MSKTNNSPAARKNTQSLTRGESRLFLAAMSGMLGIDDQLAESDDLLAALDFDGAYKSQPASRNVK